MLWKNLDSTFTEFKEEQAPNPKKSFFKYQFRNFTVDFLPELKAALTFRASFDNREIVTLNNVDIPFINYKGLLTDKQATSRPKDIRHIEQLALKRKMKE